MLRKLDFFHEIFEYSANLYPKRCALEIDDVGVTFEELANAVKKISQVLLANGVVPGDRIALCCPTSPLAVATALSVLRVGGVLATLSITCTDRQLQAQLTDSGAKILITDRIAGILHPPVNSAVEHILHVGTGQLSETWGTQPSSSNSNQVDPTSALEIDRFAAIFFSSGSTGESKGILVSNRNMTAAFHAVIGYLGTSSNDAVLSFSACLSSDYAFYNIMMPMLTGATSVIRTKLPADGKEIVKTIRKQRVTAMHVFPPAILRMLEVDVFEALPHLRYISCSGDVLPAKHIKTLRNEYPNIQIFSNYGLTECKRIAYLAPDQLEKRPGSVGKAIPGVATLLLDEDGIAIDESGKTGELGVVSDLVMQGYWNQPELTSVVLKKNYIGEQNLFLTGDLFEKDADGFLHFVCRKSDLFCRNGVTINPRRIERALMTNSAVSEVVVLPLSCSQQGHVPCACLVVEGGCSISERDLQKFCSEMLMSHEIPKYFVFMDTMPRTYGGKASRRDVARYLENVITTTWEEA